MVAAIDKLAEMSPDETPGWIAEEAQWIAAEQSTAMFLNPATKAYSDTIVSGLEKFLADGTDFTAEVDAILALRDRIAAIDPGAAPTRPPTPAPAQVVTVKGKGTQKTKPFTMAAGAYGVTITGKSTDQYGGNVIAQLVSLTGDTFGEGLVNEIVNRKGNFKYETNIYGVTAGRYYLDVTMPSGGWAITFTPQ